MKEVEEKSISSDERKWGVLNNKKKQEIGKTEDGEEKDESKGGKEKRKKRVKEGRRGERRG